MITETSLIMLNHQYFTECGVKSSHAGKMRSEEARNIDFLSDKTPKIS